MNCKVQERGNRQKQILHFHPSDEDLSLGTPTPLTPRTEVRGAPSHPSDHDLSPGTPTACSVQDDKSICAGSHVSETRGTI